MVGVPRSKGCKICVQRRVKCDETRPFCVNCTKGGRPCPGYRPLVFFRDEGPRLRKQHTEAPQAKDHISRDAASDISGSSSKNSPDAPTLLETSTEVYQPVLQQQNSDCGRLWQNDSRTPSRSSQHLNFSDEAKIAEVGETQFGNLSLNQSLYAPAIYQRQFLHRFAESVAPSTNDFLPSIMKTQWVWLRHLPDLCGTNRLLDAAMRAVTLVQFGRRYQMDAMVTESRPHYGTALRLLGKALDHPEAGVSSNTLCATALLSYYEMFASSNDASWIRHAGGVGALMRQRGPERHRYGFGREILRAYRYTLVIEAFQKNQSCFLYEPQWRKVQAQIEDDIRAKRLIPDERMVLFDAGETFFTVTAESTHLCADTDRLVSGPAILDVQQFHSLLGHLEKLKRNRQAMKDSNTLFEQGLMDASMMPTTHLTEDPVFPLQYNYGNLFMSLFYSGYRTTLGAVNTHIIRISKKLVQAGVLSPTEVIKYTNENRDLSTKMCQSVPYMLKSSFLGPFFSIFGLRFATEVFQPSEPEWDWAVNKLYEIASCNLMMARHLPWYDKLGLSQDGLELAIDRSQEHLKDVQTRTRVQATKIELDLG